MICNDMTPIRTKTFPEVGTKVRVAAPAKAMTALKTADSLRMMNTLRNMNSMKRRTALRIMNTGRNIVFLVLLTFLPGAAVTSQTFDVDTVMYHGSPDTCINIVILGDGYLEGQLDKFSADADSMVSELFKVTPFGNYVKYFNTFSIRVPSSQQGAAMHPDSLIDNYFGSTFYFADIERLLVPTNESRIVSVLAENFPRYDQVIMLVNSAKYGGSGGWVCTASLHPDVNELVFHELGHSFTGLADEYWAGKIYAAESINMTQETDVELLRWRNWYGDLGVGHYPYEEAPTWFRPHQQCKMRYLGKPYCAVCIEGTIERIHSMVSPLRKAFPREELIRESDSTLLFAVDLIRPDPNTLNRNWFLNNVSLGFDADTCMLLINDLMAGSNLLEVVVEDTTTMLRVDEHEKIHLTRVSWTIERADTGSATSAGVHERMLLEIFPNPTEGFLFVMIPDKDHGDWQVELCGMDGKTLMQAIPEGDERYSLNMEHLPPGNYVIRVSRSGTPFASRQVIRL